MKYIKKILENNMTIIMVPVKNTNTISMGFFVKAGSRNETDENSGVAHFLEHMMFKGTTNRTADQLFNELDSLGSVYNAATTTQNTFYYIYGNSDDTKKLLDIILDIYINPRFSNKEINKERKVIFEEMRMRSDMPTMKLYTIIHKKLFKNTSLARDVIGDMDSVTNINKNDLINFRTVLYKPENTVFVITGNFNPFPIYKIIEKVFKPLENSLEHPVTYFNEKPIIIENMEKQEEPYVFIKKNTLFQQIYVLLVFPMYDLYLKQSQEIELLSKLLSTGFSSRLNKALRERQGITYSSGTYPISYSDSGLFLVQMEVNPSELITGLKIIMKELKKTKTTLMSKEEMKKIINVTKNETMFSLISPIEILMYFGLNFINDRNFKPNIDENFLDLKKITRVNIQNIAKEIFVRNKINLFIYGNVEETNYDFLDL